MIDIKNAPTSINLADELDEITLTSIGVQIKKEYEEDEKSRSDWMEMYEKAMKIATQVHEDKSHPWPNAANIKFPLISIGALQFHARAYPALLPSKGIVNTGTVGLDFTGVKGMMAKVVAAHLNYQFQHEMENWEEDMDRLLVTLPITGCEFKKTYYNPQKEFVCSEHVRATDLVINYWSKSLEEAPRKTHVLDMGMNEILELQRAGIFSQVVLGKPQDKPVDKKTTVFNESVGMKAPSLDNDTPYKILEWHGFLDLDEDEYKEPYIVTVDYTTGKVLRVVARYYADGIATTEDGTVQSIKPIEYFTKYDFIPNPAGGIYGIGFGTLLGTINHSVNTLINQLIDAGTLSNMQSGFISRNLRIKNGRMLFQPGEWKEVNASGMDLKQSLFPLPVREPSMVLYQLLNLLVGSGERLTSTTDMMVGENPGQNQKATTTMAVLDQGMKVFTAIYKRIRRSLTKEFQKVYALNYYYLNEDKTKVLFDGAAKMTREMYNKNNMLVYPSADPNISHKSEKMEQVQMLLQLLPLGGWNDYEIKMRILDAMEIPNPELLVIPPEQGGGPPPDPALLKVQETAKENEFRRQYDVVKLKHEIETDIEELDVKKAEAETKRLGTMLDAFAQGANVSLKSRELAIKDADSRRKNSAKSKSE